MLAQWHADIIDLGDIFDKKQIAPALSEMMKNNFKPTMRNFVNPWNEIECGSNYARSMASYALIPILSGFEFDMPNYHIGFNPYVTNDFECIWSLADAWGNFEIDNSIVKVNVYEGKVNLKSLGLKFCNKISCLKIDGKNVDFEFKNGTLYFEKTCVYDCVEIC